MPNTPSFTPEPGPEQPQRQLSPAEFAALRTRQLQDFSQIFPALGKFVGVFTAPFEQGEREMQQARGIGGIIAGARRLFGSTMRAADTMRSMQRDPSSSGALKRDLGVLGKFDTDIRANTRRQMNDPATPLGQRMQLFRQGKMSAMDMVRYMNSDGIMRDLGYA